MKRKFPLISAALPSHQAQANSVFLITLACAGLVHSADLLSWDAVGSKLFSLLDVVVP